MRALGENGASERPLTALQKVEVAKARDHGATDFAYTVAAARRSEQRRILNYVRMSDYMICDTLQSVLLESVREVGMPHRVGMT
jgi:hypothetical protein